METPIIMIRLSYLRRQVASKPVSWIGFNTVETMLLSF